jgi:hypothetical protein
MALTINHQTNDISATSGSMTIDGAAVGGGGGATLVYENEADGNSVSNIDYTSSAGTNLCGFNITLIGLRSQYAGKLIVEPLDASGNQIGVTTANNVGHHFLYLSNGTVSGGHDLTTGRAVPATAGNVQGAVHGSADDYAGATGSIHISWSRSEDRRKWQMFSQIAHAAADGRSNQNISHINTYPTNRFTDSLTADLGGFRLRISGSFQAGSVFVTELLAS